VYVTSGVIIGSVQADYDIFPSRALKAPGSALVLVHGAWHGGWCWSRAAALVRAAGVRVEVVTLTGLGERAHLISPRVDLRTHVGDVAGVVEAEELDQVVIVGHSYAGVLLGGVADRLGDRVRRLVYLDALVPSGGESAMELFPDDVAARLAESAQQMGGWRVPPWPAESFGVTDPADREWVDRRLTDHPYATLVHSSGGPPPTGVPRTYVACTDRRRDTYVRFAEAARSSPDWEYLELPCGHDAMIIAPAALASILVGAAAGRPP
jgi:pimeloyl-ACP methyl ester carboxylesterase